MKKLLCLLLVVLICSLSLVGCIPVNDSSQSGKLVYYADGDSEFTEIIKRYNRHCKSENIPEESQIEIVTMETEEFKAKLNTEIMAGGGPDIVSLNQYLPFEKLIENGAFLDLNPILENDASEDKLDLHQYNENAMNAGVFKGERLIIPISYVPNFMFISKESHEKFNLRVKNKDKVSMNNVDAMFSEYFEEPGDYAFVTAFEGDTTILCLVEELVYGSVDFENKKSNFDTPEFRKSLSNIKLIRNHFEETKFEGDSIISPQHICTLQESFTTGGSPVDLSTHHSSEIILSGFGVKENESTANLTNGMMVNKNIKNPERVLPFIKYILGERVQGDGISIHYSRSMDFYSVPVSKVAFEKNYKLAKKNTEEAMEEDVDGNVVPFDMNSDFMKSGIEMSQNIDRFCIYRYAACSYFMVEVAYDLILKYEAEELTEDEFISKLTTAVDIYLKE